MYILKVVGQNVIFHHGGICPLKATPPENDILALYCYIWLAYV